MYYYSTPAVAATTTAINYTATTTAINYNNDSDFDHGKDDIAAAADDDDEIFFRLKYPNVFGGAVSMTPEQFFKVNGFSNQYFGWGGEDDDFYHRFSLTMNMP